jgi:hypothetical protein
MEGMNRNLVGLKENLDFLEKELKAVDKKTTGINNPGL